MHTAFVVVDNLDLDSSNVVVTTYKFVIQIVWLEVHYLLQIHQ